MQIEAAIVMDASRDFLSMEGPPLVPNGKVNGTHRRLQRDDAKKSKTQPNDTQGGWSDSATHHEEPMDKRYRFLLIQAFHLPKERADACRLHARQQVRRDRLGRESQHVQLRPRRAAP